MKERSDVAFLVAEPRVGGVEETRGVLVRHPDAFWHSLGAGGIDHVGQAFRRGRFRQVLAALPPDLFLRDEDATLLPTQSLQPEK